MATRTNFPDRVEARRTAAKVRQEAYSKLSPQQKLEALPKTGAKRQRERLSKVKLHGADIVETPSEPKTSRRK